MWILENEGEALGHKRVWLRPGKRYLFGRTVAEPGQLAIQGPGAEKVSRKHVTITVDKVEEGHAEVMGSRSNVVVEDLGSKGGTKVNGQKYRSETCTLLQGSNTLQMGSFPHLFRITWFPVVLSFSFTGNQLRANPLARLRQSLEQLDIKLLSEYDVQLTTHVVSKKRNTPKGLQALINGRYIVNDGFIDAIVGASSPGNSEGGVTTSSLEQDFDANWPDPMGFLPPPGEEPVPRRPEAFAPNPARAQLFDGYTFVFYEQKQFDSLLAPITNGRGKALLKVAVAHETEIDDFVRYVKGVAGEKGLGEFEDGSEGKGVVVVKWMPSSEENVDWFAEFFRSISLRLDHRLIDQKDFLDAILSNDASGLRRPLEFESPPATSQIEPPPSTEQQSMEIDPAEGTIPSRGPVTRRRGRGPVKSRFRGFAVSIDGDDSPAEPSSIAKDNNDTALGDMESSQGGLFVSQNIPDPEPEGITPTSQLPQRSQRKRPVSSLLEPEDMMNELAPTAAQVKRRRIAAGEEPIPSYETPTPPVDEPSVVLSKPPKVKKEVDVLELARQHREEAEKRAKMEREELEAEQGDLDLAEIRRLHIEELMPLREAPQVRTREQDIADGRWDPSWNGRKNFKRFRQRGAAQGRTIEKIIVTLEEVKSKGFGIGDDYWLEDDISQQRLKRPDDRSQTRSQSLRQTTNNTAEEPRRTQKHIENLPPVDSSEDEGVGVGDRNEDDDEDDDDIVITSSSRTRATGASTNTTQSQSQPRRAAQNTLDKPQPARRTGKRPAAAPPAKEKPAKRAKAMPVNASDEDSDDDDLRFRFGRR
ncbi:putative DNA damage response protein [Rosellinia necatrix]|uniref:Putative DNA damage response protein n=1 Tax=Rosellinia necatrix TaxID=77044 RepID=A0A1W2TBV8_ROSNE|nr:putative DNA damage response protein [Rosellinia necatrix]